MPKKNNRNSFYIYETVNKINNKSYVGQRGCPDDETPESDDYLGSGKLLKRALKKYGKENFYKRILQLCFTQKELDLLEIKFIDEFRKLGKAEYNIADGGQGGNLGEKVNKRISKSLRKLFSEHPELKKKYSEARRKWWKEVGLTEEQHKHWSEIRKGRKLSEEHKRKIGNASRGKPRSAESIEKTRRKLKGRTLSEEQKRKLSEARKGKKLTEETKLKLVKCRERRTLLIETSPLRQRENIERYWLPVKKKENVSKTGLHWYNDGKTSVKAKECPEGFVPGRIGNFACSEEAKRKKSEWWKNLSQDEREAYKKNHSEGLKGHVCSTETREKISAAKKGKPGRAQSEESKAKISAALKGRKQEISYA